MSFGFVSGVLMEKCKQRVETFARVCGFYRPVQQWNPGKKEEFGDRKEFKIKGERDEQQERNI
jgi:ribonucleoside-triphosphate reductase